MPGVGYEAGREQRRQGEGPFIGEIPGPNNPGY